MRSKYWLCATLLFALSPPSQAQMIRGPEGEKLIIQNIGKANRTVHVFGPWLKNQAVADALRIAIVKRGVRVKLLTSNSTAFEPGSYFLGLKLAGASMSIATIANVRTAAPFLILDERVLIRSTALNSASAESITTTYIKDPASVKSYLNWTNKVTKTGVEVTNSMAAYFLLEKRFAREQSAAGNTAKPR